MPRQFTIALDEILGGVDKQKRERDLWLNTREVIRLWSFLLPPKLATEACPEISFAESTAADTDVMTEEQKFTQLNKLHNAIGIPSIVFNSGHFATLIRTPTELLYLDPYGEANKRNRTTMDQWAGRNNLSFQRSKLDIETGTGDWACGDISILMV